MQLVKSYRSPLSSEAQPIYAKLKEDLSYTQKIAGRPFRGTGMTIREFMIFDEQIVTPRGVSGGRRKRSAFRIAVEEVNTEALHEAVTRLQEEGHCVGEPRVGVIADIECFKYFITVWP